jgi:hypothetical protein
MLRLPYVPVVRNKKSRRRKYTLNLVFVSMLIVTMAMRASVCQRFEQALPPDIPTPQGPGSI